MRKQKLCSVRGDVYTEMRRELVVAADEGAEMETIVVTSMVKDR